MSAFAFFTDSLLQGRDWKGLELAIVRLLLHCGWKDVQYVGESGDKGADVLATKYNKKTRKIESFLFQVKSVHSDHLVGKAAIEQAVQGQAYYKTDIAVVVTNGDFTQSVRKRQIELSSQHYNVKLWNGAFLKELSTKMNDSSAHCRKLRSYQDYVLHNVLDTYEKGGKRALFIVATGLGKTVIASSATRHLFALGLKKVLVLCHSVDLAFQLQRAFWSQIGKSIPTRIFYNGAAPVPINGINFGLYQTLFGYLGGISPSEFDLIIVDEAHHALAQGFVSCIEHLKPKFLIGMTATPWRSDGTSITALFGPPVAMVSLIDGMRMGFLAKVDYRLMCDNINWDEIPHLVKHHVTVKDLNKRLFIPQRDDAVVSNIIQVCSHLKSPKIEVFSPSVAHAEQFARLLSSAGIKACNLSVSDKIIRRQRLLQFSTGEIQALTAVDVLNEGIDVPDVNLLVFLRATHSRRIFIQQLGRGLRIAKDKEKVIVLDFVTDIRRIAAVSELNTEAKNGKSPNAEFESVNLRDGVVTFSNEKVQPFIEAWLSDVASLQDCDDAQKLSFPDLEM